MSFQRLCTTRPSVWLGCTYFWYLAAVGCLGPYITLYYRQLQLDGLQIGVLVATPPLGVAVLAPIWGALADTFSAHRLLLRSALLLAALTAVIIGWVTSFVFLLILTVLLAVALAAIPALLDCYAVTISERTGGSYGRLRVWGTIGYMVGVWLVGWQMGQYVSHLFLQAYTVALLVTCGATLGLPRLQGGANKTVRRDVSAIFKDRSVALMLLTCFLVMSNVTLMGGYFSVYLTEIGGTVNLVGTASLLAALSEIPMMLFGSRLIERFGSRRILVFAVGMYVLRLFLYSLPPGLSWVVWVQLLHGFSFGLFLVASVTLVHQLAGRERAATAQGLLSASSQGFGAVTGALVGGALLDQIGAVGILRVATVGMVLALGFCLYSVRAQTTSRTVTNPVLQRSQE
jgi:MFS transporter, PPP family, 3-phenylpropionic acid transporter